MQSPQELTVLAKCLNGLPILGCSRESPAARAGLRYGDIVLSIEGVPTPSWTAFLQVGSRVGRRVSVRVFRQGAQLELSLELAGSATPRAVLEGSAPAAATDWS